MNINDFQIMKQKQQKICMITCYDYWSAKIIAQSNIDCILVGDSAAMVMHGFTNTIPATVTMMTQHLTAVAKGVNNKFIIGDLPFLSYRTNIETTMHTVKQFMQAGANAIKLEGANSNITTIKYLVESGIPVMGHIGLTPQSINQIGCFKIQGKTEKTANLIIQEAKQLENAGCFAIVLECIPANLATEITKQLTIPTIGIGAGINVSGQVLVLHDLLGMNPDFNPKFLKKYADGYNFILTALNTYVQETQTELFPTEKNSY